MTDMIERVARAIHDNPPRETRVFEAEGIVVTKDYSVTARAAIEAMRKPTHEMDEAGKNNNFQRYATPAWQAMIDAALEDETIERSER